MRRFVKVSFVALGLGAAAFVVLLAASVHTFRALTEETLIAEIRFERTGEREYLAYLRTGDLCEERALPIRGDQWRVDAQFLKWKYWATLLGLDSQYRLERLEGRYRAVAEQNSMPGLAHDLGRPTAVDIVGVAEALGAFNFLIDATYGSSTYQTIDTQRTHLVYKTPTAIITRSMPRAVAASAPALAVRINASCGAGPDPWRRVTTWTDSAARAAARALD